MKRLLFALPLLLASCAPTLQAAQGTRSSLSVADNTLTFTNADNVPAVRVVVALSGVATIDERCQPYKGDVTICRLGDVTAGQSTSVAYVGVLHDANATWRTDEGKLRGVTLR